MASELEKKNWEVVRSETDEIEAGRGLWWLARGLPSSSTSPCLCPSPWVPSPLEPAPMVDLVWHTHMQADDPRRYRRDCAALAGRFVDHTDDV